MKYVMCEHAGSGNHGCEAIVRSTVGILGKQHYFLQSFNKEEDKQFHIDALCDLVELMPEIDRRSIRGILFRIQSRLQPKRSYDLRESCYKHKKLLQKGSIVLSVGGDNYCYGGMVARMSERLDVFESKRIPVVLWGCSIDEKALFEKSVHDLKRYALITARESLTVETLYNHGIIDSVIPCADPAFTLPQQPVGWGNNLFQNEQVIGINVSDFMGYYDAYPAATYKNFKVLIDYLLKNTDHHIVFIPHVKQKGNDDLVPCRQLANDFHNERIHIVDENYNCMQLKCIISKCKLFIGCRTHSTIAAYSSCVPTLVVGYSVKARGIAKDIFGEYGDLLVDVREFKTDSDLLNKFLCFYEREEELSSHLQMVMPKYVQRAYFAKDALLKMNL